MHPEVKNELEVRFKQTVLELAKVTRFTSDVIKEYDIPRSSFYRWKKLYDEKGKAGLYKKKPIPLSHPKRITPPVVDLIIKLQTEYQLGPERIRLHLERYHGIKISESAAYRTLKKHGLSRLEKGKRKRSIHTKRYAKTVPGHHVQVDVKFLILKNKEGKRVHRFQYTTIDDATRIRALQIYPKHNQVYAIKFMDYVVEKFPFRIHTIQTDRGHEFQALFHWHVEDNGMQHRYIRPRTPQLNGKVERSHRTDQEEFYQMLSYKDDVDLGQKLNAWENFYNFDRPHQSHGGKTPYKVMKCCLT
ncbi:IS481 family transposase [bacterium]|nr:IS481 family transposase [bacterium]